MSARRFARQFVLCEERIIMRAERQAIRAPLITQRGRRMLWSEFQLSVHGNAFTDAGTESMGGAQRRKLKPPCRLCGLCACGGEGKFPDTQSQIGPLPNASYSCQRNADPL